MRVVLVSLFAAATILTSCRGDERSRRRLDEEALTAQPTPLPTQLPTPNPTPLPTISEPTYEPTAVPSALPSVTPTDTPSSCPTSSPTTYAPSVAPIPSPTTPRPSSSPTAVPTLSCDDIVLGPTPRLSSAEFSRSGAMVLVDFSESTDQAGRAANEPFLCSQLLSFPNSSMAECYWINATQIDATVSEAGLLPGENVTLLENTLKSACQPYCHCFDFAPTSSVASIASTIPVPAVVFQGPSSISVCDELSLSAEQSTGSGGRPMIFDWAIEALRVAPEDDEQDQDDEDVESLLEEILSEAQGLAVLRATSTQLADLSDAGISHLNVSLALTNSFELVDRSFKVVQLLGVDSSGNGVPSLQIVGGATRRLTRSESLVVVAEAFATDCTGDRRDGDRRVDLVWTLSQDGLVITGLNSTSNNVLRYQLQPYTLEAATTYDLTATAIDVDGLNNTAFATIDVGRGTVTAIISGGALRSAWVDEVVTISAAESRDDDVREGEDSNLTYAWDCAANMTSTATDCDLFDIQDSSFIYIPAGTLSAGEYVFTVNVTTTDGRTATASTVLSLEAATRPTVDIVSSLSNVRAESKVTIEAEVTFDGAVSSEWSLLSGELASGFSLSEAARTEITASALEEDQTNQYRHDLVLSANSLVPGGQYALTLRAQKADTETFGFSVIEFIVNAGPTSGNLLVSPSSGRAFFDTFELRASNWVTDPDALPLHYAFKTENDVILRASSLDTVLSNARLPAPNEPPLLPLTLVVADALGAEATRTRVVEIVTDISNSSEAGTNSTNQTISEIAEEALDAAFAQYSLDAVCQVVTASASASDGDASFIDKLVTNLTGFVELYGDNDRETSEQVAASLLAPTSFSSELKPETVVDALNLVQGASEVLVVQGLGDSETATPDVIARVLSNLLESSLFSEFDNSRRRLRREEIWVEEQRSDATSVLLTTVDSLALAQRNNLVENEASIGFTSTRVRSASRLVSSALGEISPSIATLDMNASARVTAVEGVSYAASVTEFDEINVHVDQLIQIRSNVVRLQLNASGAEAPNTTEVELLISGSEDLDANSTGNATFNVTCECGVEEVQTVTCPGDVDFNVTCTGIPQEIVFACPGSQHSCSTWNGTDWIEPPDCTTIENDDGTTACVCNVANEPTGRDYTTVSELREADQFPKNLFDSPPSAKESQLVIIAFGCLITVIAFLMIFGWGMDKRSESKDMESNLRSLTRPTLSWLASTDTLPVSGRKRRGVFTSTGRRIYRIFEKRHPFTNYFFVYNPLVSRSLRAFKMGVDVIVLFLALGLETFFEYRPEIDCEDFESESKCENPRSRGTNVKVCTWDRCSNSCAQNDIPSDGVDTIEHFIILILVLALCLPLISFADWLYSNYLLAPVPRPLRWIFCCGNTSMMTPSSMYGANGRKRYTKGDELEEDEDEIIVEQKEGEDSEVRPRGMRPPLMHMASSRLDNDDSAIIFPDDEDDDDDYVRNAESESVDLQVDSIYTVNAGSVGFTMIDGKADPGGVPADDDSDEGIKPRRNVGRSDLPWLILQCEETMNVGTSNYSGKKKLGRHMPNLGKAIKISVRTAQSAAASTHRAVRCHPPWAMTESRRVFTKHEELLRNLASRVKHAIRLRQIELRELEEQVRKTEKNKSVASRAIARLRRLEAKLLDEWRWVPAESIWEANIREKIRTEIDEAFKLKAELDQIRGYDAQDTRYLRQQKILEKEKARHLTNTEKMIYHRTKKRSRWQIDVPSEPPHTITYILAWLYFVFLFAFVVYFSLLLATDIGKSESKLWLIRVLMAVFLFYCVITPLEILWFDYWLPSLLSERMNKIRDPTKIKKFPYETTVPETATFYLVLMNQDEYRDTRIGAYTFSNSVDDSMSRRDSRVNQDFYDKELEDIYSDIAYKPRLGTRIGLFLSSLLLHVPNAIYELVFEEVLLLVVLGSGVLTKLTLGDSDHSESLALAVVVVIFLLLAGIISFLVASCNYLEARYIIATSRVDVDSAAPTSSSS